MKKITVLIIFTLSAYISYAENYSTKYQPSYITRRQAVSYSTSVVHQDPKNPNQSAKSSSSIQVDFSPSQFVKSSRQISNTRGENYNYHSKPKVKKEPHIQNFQPLPNYHQNTYQPSNNHNTQILQSTNNIISTQNLHQIPKNHKQSYSSDNNQSQLFNVGYSVRFKNDPPKYKPQRQSHVQRHQDGDIITGTRKAQEVVQKPDISSSHLEYVTSATLNNKKQKYSAGKHKQKYEESDNIKQSSQTLLSPITQKYLAALKSNGNSFATNTPRETAPQKSAWQSLSPSVEIYRSTEIPLNHKHLPTELFTPVATKQQQQQFDHERALGKSQGFDYTNAIDSMGGTQQQAAQHQPNSYYDISQFANPADLIYPNHEKTVLSSSSYNNVYSSASNPIVSSQYQKPLSYVAPQYEKLVSMPTTSENIYNTKPLTLDLFGSQSGLNERQSNSKEYATFAPQQSIHKFPLDTSLLRNPIITESKSSVGDPKSIPIQIDTRLLEQALKKNFLENQQQQSNTNFYASQPEYSSFVQNFQPLNFQEQFKSMQEDFQQQQQQFKIYGTPQTSTSLKQPNYTYKKTVEDYAQRQPRFNNARTVRQEFNIQTRLRPPPLSSSSSTTTTGLQRKTFTNSY